MGLHGPKWVLMGPSPDETFSMDPEASPRTGRDRQRQVRLTARHTSSITRTGIVPPLNLGTGALEIRGRGPVFFVIETADHLRPPCYLGKVSTCIYAPCQEGYSTSLYSTSRQTLLYCYTYLRFHRLHHLHHLRLPAWTESWENERNWTSNAICKKCMYSVSITLTKVGKLQCDSRAINYLTSLSAYSVSYINAGTYGDRPTPPTSHTLPCLPLPTLTESRDDGRMARCSFPGRLRLRLQGSTIIQCADAPVKPVLGPSDLLIRPDLDQQQPVSHASRRFRHPKERHYAMAPTQPIPNEPMGRRTDRMGF